MAAASCSTYNARCPAPGSRCAAHTHAALRPHHLRQRIPSVSGPARHGQADPAVVRWLRRGMDDVPRLFPDDTSARVCIRRSGRAPPVATIASRCSHCTAHRQLRGLADHSRRAMETAGHGKSVLADPRPAGGNHRSALSAAVHHQPARSVVVRAQLSRAQPVPAVRTVESRVDAGAGRLSVRPRTLDRDAHAVLWLVGCLCGLRAALRRVRLVQPARARTTGRWRRTRGRHNRQPCLVRSAAERGSSGSLVRPGGDGFVPAARRFQSHLPEHCCHPLAVGRAAGDLPAHVHPLLRWQRLVPPRTVRADARRSTRRHGLDRSPIAISPTN